MKKRLVALSLLVGASASAGESAQPYRAEGRAAQIKGAIVALGEAPPALVKEGAGYARTLQRGACSAGAQRLQVECMIVALGRYCRDRGEAAQKCALYMDIVASNVLADERLVPREKRYEIIRTNTDYRPALARELHRVQGALAVDFRLRSGDAEDPDTLAKNIDRYCLTTGDDTHLAYQTCVSSLVWFIKGPK